MRPPEAVAIGFASARNLLRDQGPTELEREASPSVQRKSTARRRTSTIERPEKAKPASSRKPRSKKQPKSAELVISDDEGTHLDKAAATTVITSLDASEKAEERRGSISSAHEGKATGKRKRAAKTPKEGDEKPKPKPRKRVASAEKVAGATTKRRTSAARTKAAPKSKAVHEAEVEPTVVATNASTVLSHDAPLTTVDATSMEETSHHFGGLRDSDIGPNSRSGKADKQDPVYLEQETEVSESKFSAPVRRRSWTPVNYDLPTSFQEVCASHEDDNRTRDVGGSFSHLVGAFALESADPAAVPEPKVQAVKKAATREKRVEGADGVSKARAKTTKPKSDKPKKEKVKKQTIPKDPKQPRLKNVTAYALAAYQQTEPVPETHDADLLTQYLQTSPNGEAVDSLQVSTKPKKSLGKLKFDFPMPEKADRKLKNQDFMFGTSSQLARDESPTFLRQMQQAIEESEEAVWLSQGVLQDASPSTSRLRVAQAPHGTSLSIAQSAGRLWAVATRDADQKTFAGDERPSKVRSIDEREFQDVDDLDDRNSTEHQAAPTLEVDERQDSGFVDISDTEAAIFKSTGAKDAEVITIADDRFGQREEHEIEQIMPSARQVLQEIDVNVSLHGAVTGTSHELKAATPLKARDQQMDLEQPSTAAKQTDKQPRGRPKKVLVEAQPTSAKPRGRPPGSKNIPKTVDPASTPRKSKKVYSSPYEDIDDLDEICDSEAATATPSPPRRLASSPPLSPIPLQLSPKAADSAVTSQIVQPFEDKSLDCADIFAEISRVVKSQPRTRDLKRPTWYEKMLMYDPIVLEDLTTFLNEQGLRMEVEKPKIAGKSKKSKAKSKVPELDLVDSQGQKVTIDDQPVETVREELKPAFVQRWCEHNSVCCLWKEGLRGGVRQRY